MVTHELVSSLPSAQDHTLESEVLSASVNSDLSVSEEEYPEQAEELSPIKINPLKEFGSDLGEESLVPLAREVEVEGAIKHNSSLNTGFTFETFVEGKSNQLALAAARQVAENPGASYNPLFLYGGVGLGKTHLMHAVGNFLVKQNRNARVVYLHSERFVADMVKALQLNAINDFKKYYRSVDALLIDDIQFLCG